MNRLEKVRKEVKELHEKSSDECMRIWFFEGHVDVVADYCKEISRKVGANPEISILGALFHDIARVWGVNKDPELMNKSLEKTEEIMKKYNYNTEEIQKVKDAILTHSCRGKLPKTEEGRILATADALAHLMTDFYFIIPFNGWLTAAKDFEGYKKWLLEKIERDFHKKIFYSEYKKMAKNRYEALKLLFSKTIQ